MGRHGPKRRPGGRVRNSRNPGYECECGNPKSWHSQACRQCYVLDGGDGRTFAILMLLRANDTVTVDQIVMETGYDRNAVYSAITSLIRRGRVRNLWPRNEQPRGTVSEYVLVR